MEIIINLVSNIPDVGATQMDLPLTFSSVAVSSEFIIYFSIGFIIITNLISSLVIGLVNKGEEKAGLRLFIPLTALSLGIFFAVRIVLSEFLAGAFALI